MACGSDRIRQAPAPGAVIVRHRRRRERGMNVNTNRRTESPAASAVRTAVIILAAAALAGVLFAALGQRPVWLVEAEFAPVWRQVLMELPDAPSWKVMEYDRAETDSGPYGRSRGFRITTVGPKREEDGLSGLPVVYRNLSRSRNVNRSIPLALDPWLVFRRNTAPVLTRSELEKRTEHPGSLLLSGTDRNALRSWAAQLLQESPGRFAVDPSVWRETIVRLPGSGRFQTGALTYRWDDIWPRLFGTEIGYLYAPLSRIQTLPGDRTSLLEADRFPESPSWNEYGIQARILWAVPFNASKRSKRMDVAAVWLESVRTQSRIAELLRWSPAHHRARAVNPLALAAQRAWIGSSVVWEFDTNAGTE